MVNTELLRKKMNDSGYKLTYIAKQIGITYQGFLKKINNETEFKATEIQLLCKLLNVGIQEKEVIFFASDVE